MYGISHCSCLYVSLVVDGDEFLATESTCIWISMWVVSGDELLVTQRTEIQIVLIITLHVSLFIVPEDEFSTGWSVMCFFMQWLKVNPISHRAQQYVILLASLFMWYHSYHSVMDAPHCEKPPKMDIFWDICIFKSFSWFSQ